MVVEPAQRSTLSTATSPVLTWAERPLSEEEAIPPALENKDHNFWKHVLLSNETKLKSQNDHFYIYRKKMVACKPENVISTVKYWWWQHHAVGIFVRVAAVHNRWHYEERR
ncbi:hypothetical protein XENOCAPTIV_018774 [Xenoophorus captivus]|uniref:Uncharacterized protein n=1 Tax=Xenoophorus captivus TaxID=1517983 RepID=A0ABV0QJ11_9TELE